MSPMPHTSPSTLSARWRLNANPAAWEISIMAEVAIAIALAAVLGLYARVYTMPQGGSVSLEMLPIVFVAVRRGVGPALVGGGLYGLLQLILPGAFLVHPAQVLLDYPLAYMALAVAGLVAVRGFRGLIAAVSLATAARFVFHFLSGLIFFGEYAPEWEAPWLYSITYNLLYLVPEGAITVALLWPLLKAYDAAFPSRHAETVRRMGQNQVR